MNSKLWLVCCALQYKDFTSMHGLRDAHRDWHSCVSASLTIAQQMLRLRVEVVC